MPQLAIVLVLVVGAGCAANSGRQCNAGADCASGVCTVEGRCLPVGSDAGPDGAVPDASSDASIDPPRDAGSGDAARDAAFDAGGGCVPNRDGVVEASEVPLRAGLRATFLGATDVSFDTRGEDMGGSRTWDLSGGFAGDRMVLVETRDPAGLWFADDFPGATYVTELSLEQDLLGVFEVTGDALLLRGVVSPDDGFTRTKLTYDPAVPVLDFPLSEGKTWSVSATVSGVALGAVTAYTERYDSAVDARGTLTTPFGSFEVLRVRTELTRTVGLLVTKVVSFAFVSECFGTVATLTGQDGDDGAELTELAEVRRLAP